MSDNEQSKMNEGESFEEIFSPADPSAEPTDVESADVHSAAV